MSTLQNLRRLLSRSLGGFQIITTGIEVAGVYTNVSDETTATRKIITTDLTDEDFSGSLTDTTGDWYNGAWAYDVAGPAQRRVVQNGYRPNNLGSDVSDAATPPQSTARVATLTVERPFSTVLAAARTVEFHKWPVLDADRKSGLHTLINRALRALYVEDQIDIPGVTNSYRYSLSSHPWLQNPDQLLSVRDYESVANMDAPSLAYGGKIRIDGETPYLIIQAPVSTGRTFSMRVLRPRFSLIKVGATWGNSTVGLVNETDEVTGREDEIALVAEYFACREQMRYDPQKEGGTWGFRAREIAQIVGPSLRMDLFRGSGGESDLIMSSTGDSTAFLAARAASDGSGGSSWP